MNKTDIISHRDCLKCQTILKYKQKLIKVDFKLQTTGLWIEIE